jgi:hypothetical protein
MSQQHVVINRSSPIGNAVSGLLYLMIKHGEALPGTGDLTRHEEANSCVTRIKVCMDHHVSGRHYGCRNAWISEDGSDRFRVYLTDFEETVDLFKQHESFESGLSKIDGYSYGLQEIHQACQDIQAFLVKGVLPIRGADRPPIFHNKLAVAA